MEAPRSPKRRKKLGQLKAVRSGGEALADASDDENGVYFNSEMANRAADGVKSGQFVNILDFYHSWSRQVKNNFQPGKRHTLDGGESRECTWCGERAVSVCPLCSKAKYCSRTCQLKDYTTHAEKCVLGGGARVNIATPKQKKPPRNEESKPKGRVSKKQAEVVDEGDDEGGSFVCKFCPKTFKQSSSLKTHQRTHTGEKPFQCLQCNKTFSASFALRRHERIHTGEKAFACETCQKTFSRKDALKQHERVHVNALLRAKNKEP